MTPSDPQSLPFRRCFRFRSRAVFRFRLSWQPPHRPHLRSGGKTAPQSPQSGTSGGSLAGVPPPSSVPFCLASHWAGSTRFSGRCSWQAEHCTEPSLSWGGNFPSQGRTTPPHTSQPATPAFMRMSPMYSASCIRSTPPSVRRSRSVSRGGRT